MLIDWVPSSILSDVGGDGFYWLNDRFASEIISPPVRLYFCFPLSLRMVEELPERKLIGVTRRGLPGAGAM